MSSTDPTLWISLTFFLAALVCYCINSITWLISAWDRTTLLQKVLRLDLRAFFPGRYRDQEQLRWFRIRLNVGNSCLAIAILAFFLNFIFPEMTGL